MKSYLLLLLLTAFPAFAQSDILSAGGDGSGAGGSISFSIGQNVYTTNGGTGGWISQGVQHQYEVSMLNVENPAMTNLKLVVYPNPTSNTITLKAEEIIEDIRFELYTVGGILLEGREIETSESMIDTSTLPTAVYFLKVFSANQAVSTFKIIKK